MRSPEQILENLNKQSVKHCKNDRYKFSEIYKHFLNPLFYKHAYAKLYANKGSSVASVDGETHGFSDEAIQKIINCMEDESYKPKPVKHTYISKKNERIRPAGIPAMIDRYVQEIANEMLTIIYEPIFSGDSYGFRQGLSCHSAIRAIQSTFQSAVWFIEGDVKSLLDNIDHHIMIEILKLKIDDERFIRLIWKFLKAGYLEDWKFHKTYSGTPLGGIISPLLANIYLNEFDKHIKELQSYSTKSHFRKLYYVRYAGDFILGVIGSREEAENIKQDIKFFLKERLKTPQERLLIKHSSGKARFLSYEISICQNGIMDLKSDGRGQILLTIPKDTIIKKLKELNVVEDFNAKVWRSRRNTKIIGNTDLEIVRTYNEQIIGLYNYFSLANNISSEMNKFYQIMKWSMFHTLASKYKSTIPKMLKKYRIENTGEYGIPYETERGMRILKFYHEGFKRIKYVENDGSNNEIDYIPNMYNW